MPELRGLSLKKLAHLPGREITLSLMGWSAFLVYRAIHCQLYNVYINTNDSGPFKSIIWALQEYGIWVILTPILWHVMSRYKRRTLTVALCAVIALCISVSYRVGIDLWTTPSSSFGASLVYFLPTHISVLAFLMICWLIIYGQPQKTPRTQPSQVITPNTEASSNNPIEAAPTPPSTTQQVLTVQKGSAIIALATNEIDYISAAGNYVDIFSRGQTYLLRATMKQLSDQLPQADFVRIHRSYIINVNALKSLTADAVQLRTEQTLPVGAKYHREIKNLLKS